MKKVGYRAYLLQDNRGKKDGPWHIKDLKLCPECGDEDTSIEAKGGGNVPDLYHWRKVEVGRLLARVFGKWSGYQGFVLRWEEKRLELDVGVKRR